MISRRWLGAVLAIVLALLLLGSGTAVADRIGGDHLVVESFGSAFSYDGNEPSISVGRNERTDAASAKGAEWTRGEITGGSPSPVSAFVAPQTAPGGLRTVADEIGEVRSYPSYRKAQADLGTSPSSDIHHIVEQCQCSPARSGFSVSRVNSTDNLIRLPGDVHDRIGAFYSSRPAGFSTTVRNTLNGMPFEQQYDFGLDVIRRAMGGPL